MDRQLRAGSVAPLLHRTAIDHEIERVTTEPKVIQQRASLGGCTINRNPMPLILQLAEQAQQGVLERLHLCSETPVAAQSAHSPVFFLVKHFLDLGASPPRNLKLCGKHSS